MARTPQQNGVAERMNRTLIEAARTMLANSHLPTTFWAEAVNTACYTFNRVRVTKPQNKTPYELLFGHKPIPQLHKTISGSPCLNEVIDIDEQTDEAAELMVVSSTSLNGATRKAAIFRKELDALIFTTLLGPVHTNNPTTSTNPVNTGYLLTMFGIITDFNNLPDEVDVSTNHTLRIHNAHPQSQILGDPNTPVQTRSSLKKITEAHALVSYIQAHQRSNHKDQQHCLFACFLSQFEPRKVSEALEDGSWVEAMQEELLQFKLQQVWVLVDLPNGAKVIGTKWVYRNKKDERGVVVRNKARAGSLKGHRQEEGID
ncbi:retrovirus-related pol polyprotein from transposon TNT 1-94 [Tanacetum coccineum]